MKERSGVVEVQDDQGRIVSEMGNKPNSRDDEIDAANKSPSNE